MKLRFVRVMCALALCLVGMGTAKAQQPYRQLTPNDFTGRIPAGSAMYIAYTNCTISLDYKIISARNGYYNLAFNVQMALNHNKSWMNRQRINSPEMMAEVLRHEQGHYQLAYLLQQELQRTLSQTRYTANYQAQVNAIFARVNAEYKQLNADYDDDTNHMLDRKQQTAWANWLNQQVMQTGNLAMNN